ncbi:39732_t:CDS:2 [Gigaspora margarita]|uniref:39732_t:CDS:1 n=1 Tax=Gigaspora margarita TaxID=4874 RepID=A0ABM8W0R2_GIGMA|nr:39732_t:CDS:2 [Gigaspora margarita]
MSQRLSNIISKSRINQIRKIRPPFRSIWVNAIINKYENEVQKTNHNTIKGSQKNNHLTNLKTPPKFSDYKVKVKVIHVYTGFNP